MFWTRTILWKIIKVLEYLHLEWSGTIRQEKRNIFFVPYLTRPHVFRHTFCTNMANAGMDIKTLQYVMGHSDVGVTLNVYTHASYDRGSRADGKNYRFQGNCHAGKAEKIRLKMHQVTTPITTPFAREFA